MSNVQPLCVFCLQQGGKLNLFETNRLNKCIAVLKVRKDGGLRSTNVSLPREVNNFQKYHSQCYRRFTALPPKYRGYTNQTNSPAEHAVENKRVSGGVDGGRDTAVVEGERENADRGDNGAEGDDADNDVQEDDVAEVDRVENAGEKPENPVCLFCSKNRKKHQGRELKLHMLEKEKAFASIHQLAMDSNDTVLVETLHNLQSQNELTFYHVLCRKRYEYSAKSVRISREGQKTEWHTARDVHAKAYEEVCELVSENIVERNQSFFMSFLNQIFTDYLERHKDGAADAYTTKPYHLEERLLSTFARKISIITHDQRKLVKPYKAVLVQQQFQEIDKQQVLFHAALILRQEIQNIKKNELPDQVTSADLIKGECTVPDRLIDFYSNLINGPSYRPEHSDNGNRLAQSFSEDIIYAVSNGRIKPSKHICLGMSLKSLTNSKKIVNIVNRYGHCCSYTSLEGIETEGTLTSSQCTDVGPEGINRSPNLCTGVAIDNFDKFVDTTSGKDTLHDTVGIIFQNVDSSIEQDSEDNSAEIGTAGPSKISKKRRRRY